MSVPKRGLGRGLGALIPAMQYGENPSASMTSGSSIVQVEVSKILPNPRQPRKVFDTGKLEELSSSIKEQGITSPVLLRKKGDGFELVAGERRLRAAKKAGISSVPAIIKNFTDEQSLEIAIVENLQRENLSPIEEALAYRALLKEFKLTHEQISKKVGKNRSTVTNTLRLLELPQEIQDSIAKGQITAGHARAILSAGNREKRLQMWREILKGNLNVRDTEIKAQISKPKFQKKKKSGDPGIYDISEQISDHLGTKVIINGDHKKGRISIHYFSQEDLEKITDQLLKK